MSQEVIEILLKASQDTDPNVRKAAAVVMGGFDNSHIKSALIKLLKDKVWQVREAAVNSVGALRVVEAVPVMISILGCGNENAARTAILQWAAAKGEPAGAAQQPGGPAAMTEKKKAPDNPWQLKKAAALALSRLRPDIAVDPLVAALSMENPSARVAALVGLGNIQAEQAVDSIVEALSDKDWNVRKVAATTLGRIKAVEAVNAILELLEDEKFNVRLEAVIALNHIKPPEAMAALSKVVTSDNNYEVRKTAATALGNLKDPNASDALLKALEDENWMIRKAALDALTNLKSVESKEVMTRYLADEHEDVRNAAASGIIRLELLSKM